MSNEVHYIVNSCYYKLDKDKDPNREDFIFVTYKKGLSKNTHIRIERDTSVEFFVTKEQFQNQNIKKQTEKIDNCERYSCQQKDLNFELAKALKMKKGWYSLADLSKNLYVYGADISSEYHLREKYNEASKVMGQKLGLPETVPFSSLTRGGFDIETSVLGVNDELGTKGNEINLITFVDDDFNVYTSVFKPFLRDCGKSELIEHTYNTLGYGTDDNKIERYGLKLNFFISESEVECIKWIFDKIHKTKIDFISVWNMGFDIPKIISRLEYHGVKLEDVFCTPEVPEKYRYFYYKHGKTRPSEHFAERWDWCFNTAYHQFYDSMATFAKIRKVDGHENSYRLGYITDKYVAETKLFASEESTHHVMQTLRFKDYVAYNIWDAVLLVILEKKMNHVHNLLQLSNSNPLSVFNKNTTKCKNNYYTYCKTQGEVLCTVVGDAFDTDNEVDETPALGGAVLDPNLSLNTGVNFIIDNKRSFKVHRKNKDVDATAMYPSIGQAINDSRDSVLYTILSINGKPELVEDFCANFVDTAENVIYLANKYFNLPNYEEMIEEYKKEKNVA